MTAPLCPDRFGKPNRRKERRFKTSDEQLLRCRTSVNEPGKDHVWDGTAVDISQSGMRLLTKGNFQVGQAMWVELITTRSHGVYRGNVRRIEPWVDGQMILGCSLRDLVPNEVLQELAGDGIINRRSDGRFSISHPAKIDWPLSAEEIDVELQDYSSGGMKIQSRDRLPENARLRLRFETGGREVTIEAKPVWNRETDNGWVTGIAFSNSEATTIVAETLGLDEPCEPASATSSRTSKTRQAFALAVSLALFGYLLVNTL